MAATQTSIRTKEQPMFPTAHPDTTGQLAIERAAGLRAAAQRYRSARPVPARWRPAVFREPVADLSRVPPLPAEADATPRPAGPPRPGPASAGDPSTPPAGTVARGW
jgi:hypothetical protein